MISFATSFSTSFASGLKTQMIKLVQNIMGPEAAGGQTKTAWQGLQHHLPQIPFPFRKGSMLVSTPWSEWKRSTGLQSTKPASLPAPEAVQKAVAAGGLC